MRINSQNRQEEVSARFPVMWVVAGLAVGVVLGLAIGWRVGIGGSEKEQVPVLVAGETPKTERNGGGASVRSERVEPGTLAGSALERLRELAQAGQPSDFGEMFTVVPKLAAAECAEALKILRRVPAEERRALINALAGRWAEVDANGAFSAAVRERDNDIRNRLGYAAGAVLVANDPDAALQRITEAKGNDLRVKAAEWVLPALARNEPTRAAEFLASNKSLLRQDHLYREVARAYGRAAPGAALAWAESIGTTRLREEAKKSAWIGWAESDPISAARAVKDSPPEKFHADAYSAIGRAWSKADPTTAMAWINSLTDDRARGNAYGSFEIGLEKIGVEGARSLIEGVNSEDIRKDLAGRVSQELARDDPGKALAWAESLPAGPLREQAFEPALREWSQVEPAAATSYIAAMPESPQRQNLLGRALHQWSEADTEGAFAYIEQLPAGPDRDTALDASIRSIANSDPKKAMAWLELIESPEMAGRVAENLVGAVVQIDPAQALEMAARIPADAQPKAYYGLIRNWAFEHSQEAGEWINTLPAGKGRDSAVKAYVSVIDGTDPAMATKWAHSIGDPIERTEATFSAFHRWLEKDRDAARTWVNETEIPEGFRPFFDRLLNDEKYAREFR